MTTVHAARATTVTSFYIIARIRALRETELNPYASIERSRLRRDKTIQITDHMGIFICAYIEIFIYTKRISDLDSYSFLMFSYLLMQNYFL